MIRGRVLIFCLAGLAASRTRAYGGDADEAGQRPGLDERIAAARKRIAQKQYDEAERSLLSIEREGGLDDATRLKVCRQLMTLYGARSDETRRVQYAEKMLALSVSDVAQRTEALGVLAAATDYGRQYAAAYLDASPGAGLRRMRDANRRYREELVRLNPGNAAFRIALGNLYVEEGAPDEASAEFQRALELPRLSAMQQGEALTGLASASLFRWDRAAALRHCEELDRRDLKTSGRGSQDPAMQAKFALQFMGGPTLDALKLPFHTGARAFPTPQRATYAEEFVPLTSVRVVLGSGIGEDDARLQLLRAKFRRFGIAFAERAPFVVRISTEPDPSVPDRPEAYALSVHREGADLRSRDAQGTLWGIVSLIQLLDLEGAPRIRIAEIVDYPDTARRGFLQGHWKDALEYALFCKMNTVVSQSGPQITFVNPTVPWTPLQREICRAQSEAFAAFGLKMYYGINAWTMWCRLPLSSERTFELHRDVCLEIARGGGHVYFPYDDGRFPLPEADLRAFGSAANMDAKHLTRLFAAVRAECPGFHMVFCPPFYWGPDSAAAYPEAREPYLRSLGDRLDPAIEVIWTGPRVKGYEKTRAQVEWFTGLTKHRPTVFQNGTGPHNLLSYITDETPGWRTWHYDGFFERDIEGFLKNAHMGMEAPQTTTLADCLWNVKAYDPAASIRRGVAMLYGRDMFDILDPANRALAYLDKYVYGAITPEAVGEMPEIERRAAVAEEAYRKGLEYNAFSLGNFPGALGRGIDFARRAARDAKNAPDFYKTHARDIAETRALAEKEVGIDVAKGDLFRSPVDLLGGKLYVYDNKCPKRFGSCIRGRRTPVPSVRTTFECDPFPPSGPYLLFVSAQDDDAERPCGIRISVNGTAVFEGPSTFTRFGWSTEKFTVPFDCLKRGNALVIECTEDAGNNNGPPWFMVNYVVIKKAAQ